MSDEPDLLKPDEVTDNGLQIELGNLRDENELLRQENKDLKFINGKLKLKVDTLIAENEALKASPAPQAEIVLPDADTLLNELKKRRPKSKCSLPDMEDILEILES